MQLNAPQRRANVRGNGLLRFLLGLLAFSVCPTSHEGSSSRYHLPKGIRESPKHGKYPSEGLEVLRVLEGGLGLQASGRKERRSFLVAYRVFWGISAWWIFKTSAAKMQRTEHSASAFACLPRPASKETHFQALRNPHPQPHALKPKPEILHILNILNILRPKP